MTGAEWAILGTFVFAALVVAKWMIWGIIRRRKDFRERELEKKIRKLEEQAPRD